MAIFFPSIYNQNSTRLKLKVICHVSDQWTIFSRSCWIILKSSADLHEYQSLVSSANLETLHFRSESMLLMYMISRVGPRTEPWGTPQQTSVHWDSIPFTTTLFCFAFCDLANLLPSL